MISIHNIRSIARYETKTLLRSWFFRIFAILAILFITFFNFGVLIESNGGAGEWSIKGLPSVIPYVNLLFLNVVQAVIAIFLASDFLKRDKKLDTTEVIYMRAMTNGEYVVGKTLGNLVVFIVLNLIILAIALLFNLITTNTGVNGLAYLYYFLVISIPTLVFIMGLSFLIMSLIRNQAVTFVVLLGYVAISLFYLQDKFYYLFDYMAFNIPLTFSDFVGFGNLTTILVHRGMYFSFGVAFIFYTILLLKRLSHSEVMRVFSFVFGTLALAGGIFLGSIHVGSFTKDRDLREEMISLNDQYLDAKQLSISSYNIQLEHTGETITCTTKLQALNETSEVNSKILFSLNPGLDLKQITIGGKNQAFERKLSLVELKNVQVAPGEELELTFTYQGKINEAACFLDIDDETRQQAYRNMMYQIDKRYAFITPNYVLLTREANWYPIPGVGFGKENKQWIARQFSDYRLEVTTHNGLTAISQGVVEEGDHRFVFTNSHAQSQISIAIGNYEKINQEIDGLDFNIYYRKGHNYFSDFFEEIKDTIPSVITEVLQDFERDVDLYYPFERLSLVEVPIQFYSYERVLTGTREQIQPEMILFPEKGLLVNEADFNGRMNQRRRWGRGDDENLTPQEKKIRILQNFLATFTQEQGRPDINRTQGELEVEETDNALYAFPLFYNYAFYISSERWPVTDRVFEAYKKQASNNPRMGWMRDLQGMSEDEQGNLALLSQSFEEILNDPEQKLIVDNVIQLKGKALFSIIKTKAQEEAFEDFLYNYLNQVKFSASTIDEFNDAIQNEFGIDLIPYMEDWFSSTKLPAFLIGHVDAVNVLDGDQLKTMVKFKVSNTEDVEGIISADFRLGGGGRFGGRGGSPETISKLIHLDGNQTKQVSFLLNGTPRGLSINTLTSKNIPSEIRLQLDNIEEDKKAVPYEGIAEVDVPVRIAEDNEIILDNEDPGFEVKGEAETSLLRRLLIKDTESTSKYEGFSGWRPPRTWTLTTNSDFYGAYIRSASYIRSGEGDKIATWNVPIRDAGYYDVYAYVYKDDRRRRRNNDGEYHFIVHHDDGDEDALVELKSAEDGWNHLGGFYFSPDTAVIELTNQSESRMVVADAVKLIKQ
ncbi:golvesin C-terminal-like domain-containing protein [Sunxiuqinia indica]|uniref:golvesin C-terminal-like domain-containing protein n=1 Tax=Sunxiuqinia indica TaxID=2692584 RepID=UPI0013576352|nr:ABC transporter permease subunit [Sunxiuqinia indica]